MVAEEDCIKYDCPKILICETSEDRRLKREWPGHVRFLCSGMTVSTSTGIGPPLGALLCQLLGISLLFAFPVRQFTERSNSAAYAIVGAILSIFTLFSFITTSFMDPGILPRAKNQDQNSSRMRPPRTQNILGGQKVALRYCDHCAIYQPPRTWHCTVCDNCVLKFDHHCPWVGNCIGQRNYRYFLGFVFFVCMLVAYSFALSIAAIVLRADELDGDIFDSDGIGDLCLAIFSFLVSIFTFTLCFFHIYLLASNMTTYENIRSYGTVSGPHFNPFGFGIRPILNICLGKQSTSYLRRWMGDLEDQNESKTESDRNVYSLDSKPEAKEIGLAQFPIDEVFVNPRPVSNSVIYRKEFIRPPQISLTGDEIEYSSAADAQEIREDANLDDVNLSVSDSGSQSSLSDMRSFDAASVATFDTATDTGDQEDCESVQGKDQVTLS